MNRLKAAMANSYVEIVPDSKPSIHSEPKLAKSVDNKTSALSTESTLFTRIASFSVPMSAQNTSNVLDSNSKSENDNAPSVAPLGGSTDLQIDSDGHINATACVSVSVHFHSLLIGFLLELLHHRM